jgi:hypothetical protein
MSGANPTKKSSKIELVKRKGKKESDDSPRKGVVPAFKTDVSFLK